MSTITVEQKPIRTAKRHSDPTAPPRRPPTVFGRESQWALVERGYALAWESLNYSLANDSIEVAVTKLLDETDPSRRNVLRMAQHYLAFTDFDVPRNVQVDALLNVEDAIGRIDRDNHRSAASRALGRLREWLRALRNPFRASGRRRARTA